MDHNPLIPILNNRRLDEIENPRLQRLKSCLIGYSFTAKWIKGKGNNAPDAEFDHQYQLELSITEIRLLHSDQHNSARVA